MVKQRFYIHLSDDTSFDLADIPEHDWVKIRKAVKRLVRTKEIEDPGKAYAIAFILWLEQFHTLNETDTEISN